MGRFGSNLGIIRRETLLKHESKTIFQANCISPGIDWISKFLGATPLTGWRLKEGCSYCRGKELNYIKFQNWPWSFLNETQNLDIAQSKKRLLVERRLLKGGAYFNMKTQRYRAFKIRHLLGCIRAKIKHVFRNFSHFINFRALISARSFHCLETSPSICTENQKLVSIWQNLDETLI